MSTTDNKENWTGRLPFGARNIRPVAGSEKVKESYRADSPSFLTVPRTDQDFIINVQRQMLADMRTAQMSYFDSKTVALQEMQADIDRRIQNLQQVEESLNTREKAIAEQLNRVELEKAELNQIRQLLRIENESIRISSKDLRDQIKKYEIVIKMMMRPTQVTQRKDPLSREEVDTPDLPQQFRL
jgi:vacuolar-type H+-ATPase subunit I/STV1